MENAVDLRYPPPEYDIMGRAGHELCPREFKTLARRMGGVPVNTWNAFMIGFR